MKISRRNPLRVSVPGAGRQSEAQREIETFLRALNSYPERFARDPYISFEQYFFSLGAAQENGVEKR